MTDPAIPRQLHELPGPRGLPVLGNAMGIDVERLHLKLEDWARAFGDAYVIRLGPQPFLILSGLETSLTVLKKRPELFRRLARIEDVLVEMGGNGVFSAEGAEWQRQRRLVTKALSPRQIEESYPELARITSRLMARWRREGRAGLTSDLIDQLPRFTVDTTSAVLFGIDLNTLEAASGTIHEHIHAILPMVNKRVHAPFPYWRYVKLPADRRLDAAIAGTRAFVDDLIAEARCSLATKGRAEKRTLLEVMVALRDEDGSEFSDSDLFANVVTLLLTGEDTTSYTLAWALHTLAADQRLQKQLQDEADRVSVGTLPATIDALSRLDLFEGFALEVMRQRPATPVISMETVVATVLDGIALPKGTPILILARPSSLDARYFGDPQTICPERWSRLGTESRETTRDASCPHEPSAFLHFGAGPRFCPGRYLSLIEMKLVLAHVAAHFTVSLAPDAKPASEVFGFTMKPSELRVRFEERAGT